VAQALSSVATSSTSGTARSEACDQRRDDEGLPGQLQRELDDRRGVGKHRNGPQQERAPRLEVKRGGAGGERADGRDDEDRRPRAGAAV
jgi:hypothetical protein